MPRTPRQTQMSLRLDDEEIELRDTLAERHGIDGSGVMRQALRRWAREEGIERAPKSTRTESRKRR